MRVLAVALREPWPLQDGSSLHLHHVLRELARHAEVTLALPREPRHRPHLPPGLTLVTIASGAWANPRTNPISGRERARDRLAARHFRTYPEIGAWLRRHAWPERFDAALLHGVVLGQYVGACHIPAVWNPQDEPVLAALRAAQHGGWRSWPAGMRHALACGFLVRSAARRAAATVFASRVDSACARCWVGNARLEVVENGVDTDYFHTNGEHPIPGVVAFVGALDHPPNVDGIVRFATRSWPGIHAGAPERRLLIVGRNPVPPVIALTAVPGVELHADVPDVRPCLARASVVVVPLRTGGGLKNKILEACAMQRPVVASRRALGGLSARPGRELILADSPRSWIAQVGRLLERPQHARTIARAGYEWVRRTHSWSAAGARFATILRQVAGTP